MGQGLAITAGLTIPLEEITWRATSPGGPGGQHANRRSTRVEVTFDVVHSPSLGPRQRSRLLTKVGPVARAVAGEHRSQARNRQVALERLAERLAAALRPQKRRLPTAPSRAARERRLQDKRQRARTKAARRLGPEE